MWDLLAWLLIVTSCPVPENSPSQLWDALVRTSLSMELADSREAWARGHPGGFAREVQCLRWRYAELHDAPLVIDGLRWPPWDVVHHGLDFNHLYQAHIRELIASGFGQDRDRQALAEAEDAARIWHTAAMAGDPAALVTTRRQALRQLRDRLTPEYWHRGLLPPVVPLRHFRRIDG